jgi:hypothetical protein
MPEKIHLCPTGRKLLNTWNLACLGTDTRVKAVTYAKYLDHVANCRECSNPEAK